MKKLLFLITFLIISSHAQYFGKNKVQYQNFQWNVRETDGFKVLYYPPESLAVSDASRMLLRWNQRLKQVFDWRLGTPQPVIFYANQADFQQTNIIPGHVPQSVGGVTEGRMNRIVIPLSGIYPENDHVIGHELVHAYHYTILSQLGGSVSRAGQLPTWFIEGMSEYLSIGRTSPLTAMYMRDALLHDDFPTISEVSRDPAYFPYRYGHAIWAYVAGTWGDEVIGDLMKGSVKTGVNRAMQEIVGVDQSEVSEQWKQATGKVYEPLIKKRASPDSVGNLLVKEGRVNLAPVISPDGKWVAFISSRNLFAIELFLADAQTGEVVKQLTSTVTDEHFDALRFFNSSGTWSPDSKRFAFTVFENGDNVISVVDIPSGEFQREIRIDDVDAITQLAWSPDGRYLAASATSGAISDLYIHDLEQNRSRNVTEDLYAQLQPTWSPDGNRIAYVTDEAPVTDYDSLNYASMKIGIYDLVSDQREIVSIADWATHTDPQFTSDGSELFMVANPDGISNIYRYSLQNDTAYRITNVATGITGLSSLSTAMSYAPSSGELVFSVFSRSEYSIRKMIADSGTVYEADSAAFLDNVTLPPNVESGIVSQYLDKKIPADPDTVAVNNYSPSLRLYYIGQLGGGVTIGPYGARAGGGGSFLFTDLLGNHRLGVGVQASGSLLDIGGQVFYQNRSSRTNYGVSLSHIPELSVEAQRGADENTVTYIEKRRFQDRARLWLEYPFSRNLRFEVGTSYSLLYYDYRGEIRRNRNGELRREDIEVDEPSNLNLASASAAYVGDYSFFGMTAPLTGRRYRFELEPTVGSFNFVTALADYRYYYFLRPVTLAFRLLHRGRYLGDSENDRLSPLFLGYQSLVRGYTFYSINRSDCSAQNGFENCPRLARLFGSRIAVANAELRVPLLGPPQLALVDFPLLPIELAGFADAGAAWNAGELPELRFDRDTEDRVPIFSVGGAARVNLLNAFILQFYLARPLQRRNINWDWGFFISPGW
ncbi:MAG: peptidase S9 [Chitinispirillaceae bacterium]